MEVQHDLNADVTMIFDECTPYPGDRVDEASDFDGVVAFGGLNEVASALTN